jgi:hypothetical protein
MKKNNREGQRFHRNYVSCITTPPLFGKTIKIPHLRGPKSTNTRHFGFAQSTLCAATSFTIFIYTKSDTFPSRKILSDVRKFLTKMRGNLQFLYSEAAANVP